MSDFSKTPSASEGDLRGPDFFDLLLRLNFEECREIEDLNLPRGFRFLPDDLELLMYYLANKVLKRLLPVNVIKTLDLYSCDPDKLPIKELEDGTENEVYCFMENRDIYRRNIISTENGFWVQIGEEEAIFHGNTVIGFRKNKTFKWNMWAQKVDEKSEWIVNELRLNVDALPKSMLNDDVRKEVDKWIACRIIKRSEDSNLD